MFLIAIWLGIPDHSLSGRRRTRLSPARVNGAGLTMTWSLAMDAIHLVRESLRGQRIALVGGDPRPYHLLRLQKAFGLSAAIWVPTRESDASPRRFEHIIRERKVDLVVSLLGLLRHQHASDLRSLCRQFQIRLVTCRRSPHPAGLANAMLQQHSNVRPK